VQVAGLAVLGAAIGFGHPLPFAVLSAILVIFGVGQAMVWAPLFALAFARVPVLHAGSGGGVISTVQQAGNAAGVAAVGALYYTLLAAEPSGSAAVLASLAALALAIALTAVMLRVLARVP
jgi:hypothetical protein